jgi:hypothetical protein
LVEGLNHADRRRREVKEQLLRNVRSQLQGSCRKQFPSS